MSDKTGINAGIITGLLSVNFGLSFEKFLRSQKILKLLTLRNNCTGNPLDVKMLVKEWAFERKVDLIVLIETPSCSQVCTSVEELKHVISKDMPHLMSLLFNSRNENDSALKWYTCYAIEKSLVVQFSTFSDSYEAYFENLFSTIVSAIKEIKNQNICFPMPSLENGTSTELCSKSKVQFIKAAERPRQSPYAMITVSKALELILQESYPLDAVYRSYRDCFSFVLAEDVIAKEPYPPFPASIKDGYAVIADDDSNIRKVLGAVTPGCKPDYVITPGSCVRVSTGSVIPVGTNAVIQVEDTVVAEKDDEGNELKIEVLKKPQVMQDIRTVGSDVSEGEILIPAYKKLSAAEIGVMSTCGIQQALVYKKPYVALLSTGDEVIEPHMPLTPGCIRDSNKNSLMFMLIDNRIPVIDAGIAKDESDDVKSHLILAMETADIVISTGGVSMGERDILKQVLETDFDATIHFGRIHMKPGKPTTFSSLIFKKKRKLIFSLPGNPVSAFVCFYLFVIPCIKKMMGFKDPMHHTIKAQLGHNLKLDERPEFHRVSLECGDDGIFAAHSTGGQQSSRLLSMQNADALLVLPPKSSDHTTLKAGSLVDAIVIKSI